MPGPHLPRRNLLSPRLPASQPAADSGSGGAPPVVEHQPLPDEVPDAPAAALAPLFAPPAPVFQPPTRRTRRRAEAEPTADEAAAPPEPARRSRRRAGAERPAAPAVPDASAEPVDTTDEPIDEPSEEIAAELVDSLDDRADDESAESSARRKRRRGRRGRGRGRGGEGEGTELDDDTDGETDSEAEADADDTEEADEAAGADDEAEGADESDDAGACGVGGVGAAVADRATTPRPTTSPTRRTPWSRSARRASGRDDTDGDGVQSVRGSTRLEAKRQRRRDGRDARPPPSADPHRGRVPGPPRVRRARRWWSASAASRVEIGVLEDEVLVEHFVTGGDGGSLVGNIYLGRVQNVLPSMEAAFVDIGRGRNAVLYAGEVDWDAAGLGGQGPQDRAGAVQRRQRARAGHQGPDRAQGRPADHARSAWRAGSWSTCPPAGLRGSAASCPTSSASG